MTTQNYQDIEYTITPWIAVSDIPTRPEHLEKMNSKYGTCGVYQVIETKYKDEIGDAIVHDKIGYIGKSKGFLGRTYAIKQPNGDHGAGRYIRQNELDRSTDVCIRYLYCSEEDTNRFEDTLHKDMNSQFGYRFTWNDASGGVAGVYSQILDLATKHLTFDEICDMIPTLKALALDKNRAEVEAKLQEL